MLLALVASGSLRRRLRVFLNKHFYRNKYDYRVEWLRFIQTLSTPEEGVDTRDNCRARDRADHRQSGRRAVPAQRGPRPSTRSAASWPSRRFHGVAALSAAAADRRTGRVPARGTSGSIDLREQRETPDVYQNLSLPRFSTTGQGAIGSSCRWRTATS